jgi:hypothetical protein
VDIVFGRRHVRVFLIKKPLQNPPARLDFEVEKPFLRHNPLENPRRRVDFTVDFTFKKEAAS